MALLSCVLRRQTRRYHRAARARGGTAISGNACSRLSLACRLSRGGTMGSRGRHAAWRVALAAAGMALGMAACAARIWRDEATPQGVRLHWYTNEASIDAATAQAAPYCQAH